MSGSLSNFDGGAPSASNGMGLNGANNNYELGGNLTRPTVINTSNVNTLSLTGLVAGDPATDSIMVTDPAGLIKFIDASGLTDYWRITGNAATLATAYADAAAQTNNFLGTLDNQPVAIYTNANNANAKSDLRLYTATPTGAAIAAAANIFHVRRNGQSGVVFPQMMTVALGKWLAGVEARTRADFKLTNGNVNIPDTTPLSIFSQGGIGINGNGTNADWVWTATGGGFGRGNGGALLGMMGATSSNNLGPHVGVWTSADTFPVYYQLNWSHDNVAMLFDSYYDGAWKAASTSRPYAIYKLGGALNFYGSAAAPAAAGNAWAQDLMARFRYAGATLAGGELDFNNVAKNRRIVLWDGNAASDHQYYGFGINANVLRYQVAGTTADHVWYAATAAGTSSELGRLTGTGRLAVGINAPTARLHVSGPNANGGAVPLFRVTDTNIAGSYFAIDNGQAASAYRLISSIRNLEIQSAGNSNQLVVNTNGSVGIGTAASTAGVGRLSVATNADKPGGGAWAVFSDRRIKRNIEPVKWGLAELLKLKPVSFEYNGKANSIDDGKTYYGLVAQELQEVIPDFVEEHPIDGETYEAMSEDDQKLFSDKVVLSIKEGLTNMEALLLNAVQELSARVTELEAKLAKTKPAKKLNEEGK